MAFFSLKRAAAMKRNTSHTNRGSRRRATPVALDNSDECNSPGNRTPALSIISYYEHLSDDDMLKKISNVVEGEDFATKFEDVATILDKRRHLDLIGHSTSIDHYLMIGTSTLTIEAWGDLLTKSDFIARIQALNIQDVRLLGCGTATGSGGDVINYLAEQFSQYHIRVFGTTLFIYDTSFSCYGLSDTDVLGLVGESIPKLTFTRNSYPEARVGEPLHPGDLRRDKIRRLPDVPWPRKKLRRHSKALWNQIEPDRAWSFPGLLMLPLLEVLVPLTKDACNRIQILMDYEIVRVFPAQPSSYQDLVYQVRNRKAMKALIESLD